MASDKSHYDTTSAESTSIGFDYQYYYFLLQLLLLRDSQTIGYEIKDDLHIDLPNGHLILMQLKHTVRTNAGGLSINLTERDIDLWKTIHNWIAVIQDPVEGRGSLSSQKEFLKKTSFVLISNKSEGQQNYFFTKLEELKSKSIDVFTFKKYLAELLTTTSDTETNQNLRSYIFELSSLGDTLLKEFASKIEFRLSEDDLITQIKTEVRRSSWLSEEKVDDVYHALNSRLRDQIYLTVKKREKVEISYDDFRERFRVCFPSMSTLPIRRLDPILPDKITDQKFIRQLIDIGDIRITDTDQIVEFTKFKLLMFNNINSWIQKHELTEEQRGVFIDNCIVEWQNAFRKAHRANRQKIDSGATIRSIEADILHAGVECLDTLRSSKLSIESQLLDIDLSNGQFYLLSDELQIGWHLDFEQKYKD